METVGDATDAEATMAINWWRRWKASKPLDVVAEKRFRSREGTLKNPGFLAACEAAGISPTPRQARKWNNGKGIAVLFRSDTRKIG